MRNPMLPLSPTSNDGSLQHKPTLAPAGLNRCSRPLPEVRRVRLRAGRLTWDRAYLSSSEPLGQSIGCLSQFNPHAVQYIRQSFTFDQTDRNAADRAA